MSTPENQTPPEDDSTESTNPAPAPAGATAKPKLNLNVAPRATANNLNPSSGLQKAPERQYIAPVAEDDDQPSPILTVIAGLAAAAAITFAVLLFLKTK